MCRRDMPPSPGCSGPTAHRRLQEWQTFGISGRLASKPAGSSSAWRYRCPGNVRHRQLACADLLLALKDLSQHCRPPGKGGEAHSPRRCVACNACYHYRCCQRLGPLPASFCCRRQPGHEPQARCRQAVAEGTARGVRRCQPRSPRVTAPACASRRRSLNRGRPPKAELETAHWVLERTIRWREGVCRVRVRFDGLAIIRYW